TGKLLATLAEGHDYLTSRAEFFADGKYMVTAAADNTVRLWNVATGTQFLRLDRTGRSAALAISADERWLATGSEEDDLKLWDLTQLLEFAEGNKDRSEESRQPQPRFIKVHNGRVTAIAFAPKENRCLSCDTLGRCVLTDVETGTAVWSVRHHTRRVTACAFTPDGSQILTASNDHTVSRINSTNGQELSHLVLSHDSPVSSMALSQDGQQVVTVASPPDQESHRGAILRRWNAQTADLLATVQVEGFGLNDIQSVPNSQLAIAVATDNTVRLFSLQSDSSSEGTVWLDFDRLGGLVWSARFTKDGQSVLTVGGTEAQLWDAGTRQEKMNFSPHGTVAAADFSPDGKWIVTGSWDNSAKIWDAESGTAVRKIEGGHDGYINSVRFSPNGEQILTASDDGTAKLWHVADGKLIQSFQGHLGRVRQAVFSHNGKRILTVSSDRTARLWDREAGTMIGEPFVGHKWSLLCGAFSPDDSQILTGSEDNSAILWDLSSKKKVAEFQGHTAAVTSVAFSRDGERAFTASQDISAKLWDVTPGHEGTEILTLAGHSQELTSIDISPKDGRHLLTGSRDGTAILWLTSEWNDKAE
ncbi:MAG: WD40 repeat domain-containing protein, partial [Planctomycetaceae bacterium]|nr:WD40 repeat domain-containing protein [Planctomycetaceae bacterium]